jgi:hypothetical protein
LLSALLCQVEQLAAKCARAKTRALSQICNLPYQKLNGFYSSNARRFPCTLSLWDPGRLRACSLQELVPQMRALAETVFRLVRRDKSQTAVHLVSKLLSELDLLQRNQSESEREQRAYLLNLRGVIYAQRNQEQTALADLTGGPSAVAAVGGAALQPWTESQKGAALDRDG